MTEKSDDAAIAKANCVEHLKNIDAACDDARLSAVRKSDGSRKRWTRRKTA